MVLIPVARRAILMVLRAVPPVWGAVVAGATVPAPAPFRVGATIMPRAATTALLASAFAGFPLDFFFSFLPFEVSEAREIKVLKQEQKRGCRGIYTPAFR